MLLVQKTRKKYSDPFYWTQKQFGLQGQSAGSLMLVVWERGSLKQCYNEPNAENIEKKTHNQRDWYQEPEASRLAGWHCSLYLGERVETARRTAGIKQ